MSEFDDDWAIKVEGISKKFLLGRRSTSVKDRLTGMSDRNREEFWAFKDVSVTVPKGSMLGVIGRNGSGKSTFLRALCGIYRPTTGQVMVRGRVTALLELGAGFHPDLTGRENIYMNGSVVGLDRDHMDNVMDEIIEMADIGSFIDAPIETYSSGMRARLGFAVSVQMQPEILLADEITAVGDITFKDHGTKRMDELRNNGATIVQVSHSLPLLEANCDQVLWLHHGEMRRLGDPTEVIEEYQEHAAIDRSGRMIGNDKPAAPGAAALGPVAAKRDLPAGISPLLADKAEELSADDVNPEWLEEVLFEGSSPAGLRAGRSALIAIRLAPSRELTNPVLQVEVLNIKGVSTGFAFRSEALPDGNFGGTVEAVVDELTLLGAQYILRVVVLEDDEVVARRHVPVLVRYPASVKRVSLLDARWAVAVPQAVEVSNG